MNPTSPSPPCRAAAQFNTEIDSIAAYWSYSAGGLWHYHNTPYDTEAGPFDVIKNLPAGANGFSSPWENVDTQSHFEGSDVVAPDYPEQISEYSYSHTQTHVMIQPSGQQSVGQSILYLVQAQVTNEDTSLQLAAGAVQFLNQLAGTATEDVTNSDGSVWTEAVVSGAAGAQTEVTPQTSVKNYSFTGMKISPAKILYISVDTSAPAPGVPSTFANNTKVIGSELGKELTTKLALPASAVEAQVHIQGNFKLAVGWNASHNIYVCRVTWIDQLAGGSLSNGGHDHVIIDPIACRNYNAGSDPPTQFWVNDLAHEVIWVNICHGSDHDLSPPAGEISSGLEPPFPLTDEFTVSPANQALIISAFGF